MVSIKKQNQRGEIESFITSAQNFTLIHFGKTSHVALEKLRNKLRSTGTTVKVVKNSVLEKALNQLAASEKLYRDIASRAVEIKNNTAVVAFGEDWNQALTEILKETKGEAGMQFRFGILEKTVYSAEQMTKIASLPPKEEIMAKMIGSMKNPMTKTTYALKFSMQKFVQVLHAKAKQN